MQQSIEQAHEEGHLELTHWAENIVNRMRMSYRVQQIFTGKGDVNGPYKNFLYVNNNRRGSHKSTGDSYATLGKFVTNCANGDTVAVDFFFRRYLLFVDWGVGRLQKKEKVPRKGGKITMTKIYAHWQYKGDRQRRPVVFGGIRGGMFGMLRILKAYWGRESELAVLAGFGYMKGNKYVETFGGIQNGLEITVD